MRSLVSAGLTVSGFVLHLTMVMNGRLGSGTLRSAVLLTRLSLLACLGAAFLCGCVGDDIGTFDTYLVIYPTRLRIDDEDPQGTLRLSVAGGGEITWAVASKPEWVEVSPDSGIAGTDPVEVTVLALTEDLAVDVYDETIGFLTSKGLVEITLLVSVAGQPVAVVSTDSLVFEPSVSERYFALANSGTGLLTWVALRSDGWLTITPNTGDVASKGATEVTVSVDRYGLAQGVHFGTITILSNSTTGDIEIPVRLSVMGGAGG